MYKSNHNHVAYTMCMYVHAESQTNTKPNRHDRGKSGARRLHFFMLFKVAFSLLIAFLAGLKGSVIKMKLAALAPDNDKLKSLATVNHAVTFERSIYMYMYIENTFKIFLVTCTCTCVSS